jgi:cation:H+ antiporter
VVAHSRRARRAVHRLNAGSALSAVAVFLGGVLIVVWSTERLLHGLVGLATLARVAPFVVSAVLSGLEAENVAVGLAAGSRGAAEVALGTVFGGGIFLVCVALGLGAMIVPLRVRLPRAVLLAFAITPVLAGLPLAFGNGVTPRWTGAALLLAFAAALAIVVRASHSHRFIDDAEVEEAREKPPTMLRAVLLTLLGIGAITAGGELVASGATRFVADLGLSAGLVGMVLTPAAVEAEEVIRQVVPARAGRHDVSAGNVIGTLLWFVLFNLGLIALATPVAVPRLVRVLDYPFLVGASWIATAFLARGRVGRTAGATLVALAVAYAVLRGVLR